MLSKFFNHAAHARPRKSRFKEGTAALQVPMPDIFASRQFTAVNLVTLCVYAAFGGFFFLTALQLQVVAGYSALQAGTALRPRDGAQRIGRGDLSQRCSIPTSADPEQWPEADR